MAYVTKIHQISNDKKIQLKFIDSSISDFFFSSSTLLDVDTIQTLLWAYCEILRQLKCYEHIINIFFYFLSTLLHYFIAIIFFVRRSNASSRHSKWFIFNWSLNWIYLYQTTYRIQKVGKKEWEREREEETFKLFGICVYRI